MKTSVVVFLLVYKIRRGPLQDEFEINLKFFKTVMSSPQQVITIDLEDNLNLLELTFI